MPSSNDGPHPHSVTPTAPSALPPLSSQANAMIHILGTEFVHFYLLEEAGEITLVDAGVSGYRDTLEPALARMGRSSPDSPAPTSRPPPRTPPPTKPMNPSPKSKNSPPAPCTSATETRPRRAPAPSSQRPAPSGDAARSPALAAAG
jgi:hypothetical protein